VVGFALTAQVLADPVKADSKSVDYAAVKKDIEDILDGDYEDGSYGPVFVRLAWHSSGTYDVKKKSGGSNGAGMRFAPEKDWGGNAGLDVARGMLEPIKKKHPNISYSDLWILAGVTAIENMGGPKIPFHPGRNDYPDGKPQPLLADDLLPDGAQGAQHLRHIFNRQGFNDQEIVALSGAHSLGRCHLDRSGFEGPWTRAPTTFSNEFYRLLLEEKWVKVKLPNGLEQYKDAKTKELMMLISDMALVEDPEFKKWTEKYAKDEALFFKDFSAAFLKLTENGVTFADKAKGK